MKNNTYTRCFQEVFTYLWFQKGTNIVIDGLVFENFNASKTGTQNTLILFTVEDDASVKINGLEIKNVNLGVTIPIQVDKQLALL